MTFILGPDCSAYSFLQEVPTLFELRNGVIVVAWARRSGVGLLNSALGENLRNVDVVVGMSNRGTTAEALALLQSISRNVFVYHTHPLQTFHPKVYLFDDGQDPPLHAALLVGSSNLTGGGLYQNIEGNLALELRPSEQKRDKATFDSVVIKVADLLASPFCEQLSDDARIIQLLEDRYISTESALALKRQRDNSHITRQGGQWQQPKAPPLPSFSLPSLSVTFGGVDEEGAGVNPAYADDQALSVFEHSEQFYVRTLTENDVKKLHGITSGTAEWDIGVTTRNERPAFWGWPDQYKEVVRKLSRLEWLASGSLRSSITGEEGVDVEVCLWFREKRPQHAAEHRLRIGPRANLVNATPSNFDTSSLVVLELLPKGSTHTFRVQLLTNRDTGFHDYLPHLTHK